MPLVKLSETLDPKKYPASGVLFSGAETESAVECVTHIFLTGMTAYFYLANAAASCMIWEGEFIEIWSSSDKTTELSRKLFNKYELELLIAW